MKLLIASDIHGSDYYCKRLLDCAETEAPDRLILLGDLLYHGPRNDLPRGYAPKAVIARLNAVADKICCVRGNCEAEVDQMVLDFPVMAPSLLLWIRGRMVFATHGHLYNKENPPKLAAGDILLHGHTHVQAMEESGGYIYLNPGSVSIPKGEDENSYMTYENGVFCIKNLQGRILRQMALERKNITK